MGDDKLLSSRVSKLIMTRWGRDIWKVEYSEADIFGPIKSMESIDMEKIKI